MTPGEPSPLLRRDLPERRRASPAPHRRLDERADAGPVLETSVDLAALDAAVEGAIATGGAAGLRVLGFGEISLVIGWPTERPVLAAKRLPIFSGLESVDGYAALVGDYVRELRGRGVDVLPTEVSSVSAPTGRHVYLLQPRVPIERVLTVALAEAAQRPGAVLLGRLVAAVCAAVDPRVGLDAQAGNWAVDGEGLALFDVSTPMLRSPEGRDRIDLSLFLSIYPWVLRPALRPIAHQVMAQYHDPRTVLVDVASNLHKEQLGRWLPAFLAAANERVTPPIEPAEVQRYFRRDRALWLLMQRLRRADRAWQRVVRRRAYPFLLAPPYRYGPMTPPEEDSA